MFALRNHQKRKTIRLFGGCTLREAKCLLEAQCLLKVKGFLEGDSSRGKTSSRGKKYWLCSLGPWVPPSPSLGSLEIPQTRLRRALL